jgi:hypothetical protein
MAKAKAAISAHYRPTEDQIAARAYQLYLERGGAPGHQLDDWLEAERQLGNGGAAEALGAVPAKRRPARATSPSRRGPRAGD